MSSVTYYTLHETDNYWGYEVKASERVGTCSTRWKHLNHVVSFMNMSMVMNGRLGEVDLSKRIKLR
jgi:hypothetical protein